MSGRKEKGRNQGRRSGATAIEYALIAGGVALVIVAAVNLLGTNITAILTSVAGAF